MCLNIYLNTFIYLDLSKYIYMEPAAKAVLTSDQIQIQIKKRSLGQIRTNSKKSPYFHLIQHFNSP